MPKLVSEQPGVENRRYLFGEKELAAIEHETQIIWTDKNPTTPARVGEAVANLMPNARFDLIEDAGHWPQFEKPEEFNALCGDFLSDSSPAPARPGLTGQIRPVT